ncbi:hypothetical protein VOLCADRAFT_90793 [Volvox carteri f. nagariensis]|uniref:Uncharacterized protein n=1 Tax=Volvox carteri f. nagariensis TaxID=3068 RepID=D8TV25_VOLCA|nr:uncharacterized protein VOLCADRAFT_90793 [Volvox carteri f. nagariensis]EFJ48504.1 hypothetical protein VOLCADRAFT_90793 [Volvox carteri f. nagariensis]|eukprot:XP_002950303.1 hypothetical protein VOLCADRAFT_90793 [Volvox carteri f. nagariensis]
MSADGSETSSVVILFSKPDKVLNDFSRLSDIVAWTHYIGGPGRQGRSMSASGSKLLEPLNEVLDRCNIQQVLGAIRAIDMGPEASHHLIHIVAGEKFDKTDLTFASKRGGKFDVVPLYPETLQRGEEEKLVIQACTEFKSFTDDVAHYMTNTIKNTYLKPKSASFPLIDALKAGKDMKPSLYFVVDPDVYGSPLALGSY